MTDRFNLDAHLGGAYSSLPEARPRPVIGITGNYSAPECRLAEAYYKSVVAAGGTPLIIPPLADKDSIINTLDRIDGLLLSGGGDINPLFAGEEPQPALRSINRERDLPELLTVRLAYNRQLPMLGICRGVQVLAAALGGKVAQDISATATVKHSQDADRSEPTHTVSLCEGSVLHTLYGAEHIAVNSFHHQAVADPGPRFAIAARAADGTVEAIESSELKSIMGVQWHPECLADGDRLFGWLVTEAESYRKARGVHQRVLTLDSHCDTPMFFAAGADFGRRDPRLLVDLHKMGEGRQDAVVMVAYLPQPKPGECFQDLVGLKAEGPKAYADMIFDRIEATVAANSGCAAMARTPRELAANKLAEGSLYSREELERIDALVIMHVHDKDVYNEKNLKENYTDYQLPFDYSDYPEAYDYLIKRYLSDCYELRNDTASKYYGTTAGKPAVIILCTHWHDARTTYNASIRKLAEKWGFPLVEFDKYIGFSKRQLHPVTKEQTSLIYATGNPQVQDGIAYGWHPQSGENKYIQRRMAATFYNLMQNILY